jgi:secreted Zn-dependent insulinase-like peptidase
VGQGANRRERWYGVHYHAEPFSPAQLARWTEQRHGQDSFGAAVAGVMPMVLPGPNPYISYDLAHGPVATDRPAPQITATATATATATDGTTHPADAATVGAGAGMGAGVRLRSDPPTLLHPAATPAAATATATATSSAASSSSSGAATYPTSALWHSRDQVFHQPRAALQVL